MAQTLDPSEWGAIPSDGPASWGATSDEGPEAWGAVPADQPESSELGAFGRGVAHGLLPAGGGVAAGLAGAGVGGALGGPPGAIVGGLGAGILGGAALEKGEDWLLDKLGWRDKSQEQADQEQHPTARMLGEMAPAALTLRPTGTLAQRAIGAGIGAIGGGAADLIQNGEINAKDVLAGAGMGAAFPNVNRLGAKIEGAGARLGAAMGGKGAPVTAPETPSEEQPPSRDLKLIPPEESIEEVETPPTDPKKTTEWGAVQNILGSLDARDPLRAHWEAYANELQKATKQPDGQATPSNPPTTSLGVSEVRPAPSQDATVTGNQTGAPMVAREAARPTDPERDYRKNKLTPNQPEPTQESTPLSTDAIHPDIAAAVETGPPPQPPGQAQPMPQEPVQSGPNSAKPKLTLPQSRPNRQLYTPNEAETITKATQQAQRRPIVEAPMPSGANSSKDLNGPVYVHTGTPPILARLVAVHETVEAALEAQGMPYDQAHPIATQAEKRAVEKAGLPWGGYQRRWAAIVKQAKLLPRDTPLPPGLASDPWADVGHYDVPSPDEGVAQTKGIDATDATAAVTPDQGKIAAARERLTALKDKFPRIAKTFETLTPEEQAKAADVILPATENARAPRKTVAEEGKPSVAYRDKADQARKEGSTKAVKQAVSELEPSTLSLERTPANKAAIREHAEDLYERSKELFGGKDPVKSPEGYYPTPANRLPEHTLVYKASRIANNPKATWATLEDYVHAVALKGETGANVDAGIAASRRPTIEDAGSTAGDAGRPTFEHIPDVAEGKDNSYVEATNKLYDYVNGLSPADYDTLNKVYDDHLATEMDQPGEPEALLSDLQHHLTELGSSRPKPISPKGTRTAITDATGLAKFAPTQESTPEAPNAGEGRSLKGTPEYESLAAKYSALMKDKGGGVAVPKFINDFFTPRPYDPESQYRNEQITKFLDYAPKWFKQHANQRAADKGWIETNGRAAAAYDLSQDQLARIRDAYEHKTERSLPGKLYDMAKGTLEPLIQRREDTYKWIYDANKKYNLGLDLEEPHPGFDTRNIGRQKVNEDIGDKENVNVVTGRSLPLWTEATQPRDFVTLNDTAGGRKIVMHIGDNGKFSLVQNGVMRPLTKLPMNFEGKIGDTLPLVSGGKKTTFTVDHAAVDEIEAATANAPKPEDRIKYIKNPIEVVSNRLNQLQAIKENIKTLQAFKDDPLWTEKLSTTDRDIAKDRGWDLIPTKMPQFQKRQGKDIFMPRNIRWMLDDAFRQGFGGDDANWFRHSGSGMARIFMTFGSPIHVANIATNAVIGRGFDNITPKGIRALGVTGVRAFKAVNDAANSKDYLDFLKAGGRPQFINSLTNDLIPNIRQRMGGDISSSPSKWDPVAKIWGISTPDLARAVESISTREMWRASDMFALQRFLENRDFKGMSPEDAAADTHKFIPSYDLPSTVGSRGEVGRFMSQALADPAVSLFGRYHMDLLRSFAHVTRSVLGPSSTPQERIKGVGQLLTAGALAYLAYPALDKLTQTISGNPDAEFGRRGMLSLTDAAQKLQQGDSDYTKLASNLFTPSVPLQMGIRQLGNVTWNRKPIVQQMPLNSVKNVAKAGAQEGDWLAANTIAPYGNVASNLSKGSTLVGTVGKFAAGMVGAHLPSDAERNYKTHQGQIERRDMRYREKHPGGLLEAAANRL